MLNLEKLKDWKKNSSSGYRRGAKVLITENSKRIKQKTVATNCYYCLNLYL